MKFGEAKESEHELKQREILDLLTVIKEFSIRPFFGIKAEEVRTYINSFFSADKSESIEYNYGERLFRFAFANVLEKSGKEFKFFVNQIDKITEKLKRTPYSRRVVASLWNPFSDLESKTPPCLTQINWNVKNNRLYQTCVFRSHDLFGAYLFNVLALRELQRRISRKADLAMGELIIFSQSAHIYENSWKRVENILNEHYSNREIAFKQDQAGYFRIWLDRRERKIIVEHRLTDGRKTKFRFEGERAVSIYKKILNENLVFRIDHAAYLGKELAKAEKCLKDNQRYDQGAS
jgi:thymidylate synthase